ncbi:MAG: polysaccharide biosynthesis tyrosine autokinase [Capsulimonadales bacterium]|nr:polysaccharide biosynthesis tyrosine autokinase [Capsulimonadales bacterium]
MQDSFPASQETPTNLTLREYGDILRRRRAIILQTFVIVLVIGILVNLYTPLTYSASARLLTEAPRFQINTVNTSDPLSDLFQTNQVYSLPTQVQMIQGPDMMKKVKEKLGNAPLPAFSVKPIEGTQIIEATAEGESQDVVANALNVLLEAYKEEILRRSTEKLKKALDLATTQSREAQAKIEDLQQKTNRFKRRNSVYSFDANKEEYVGRVKDLNDQYQAALSDMKALTGKIDATTAVLRTQKATLLPFISKTGDPRIQGIDDKLVELDASRQALKKASGFKDDMPQVQAIDAQIQLYKMRKLELLNSYVARNAVPNPAARTLSDQIGALRIEMTGLQARTNDVRRRLAEAKARLANFPDWEREWSSLNGQLAKAQSDFTYFSNQLNVLTLRSKATEGSGPTILQYAVPPTKPIRPNREQNILFAGLLGVFFGLCLALLQELFDDRINTPEESERLLNLPSLGWIPMIEEEGLRLIKETSSFSPLMESYRSLRTNINFAAVGRPVRSLVVTSSLAAEGKSTTVANLAMAMAMERKRVIIVDADLRRPSLHRLFKVEATPGLTDVLVGTHTIDEVLQPVEGVENVYVIPAGSTPPNPAELLGSEEMGRFMETLETKCDVALFDSPPTVMVADSVVLASRADGVLLVIAFGETKKANTRQALQRLARANANVLGTVLNRMEGHGGGYYGYYYGKYYVPVSDRARPATGTNGNESGNSLALPQNASDTPPLTGTPTGVVRYEDDKTEKNG